MSCQRVCELFHSHHVTTECVVSVLAELGKNITASSDKIINRDEFERHTATVWKLGKLQFRYGMQT